MSSKHIIPQKRPQKTKTLPAVYDPARRLIAGYVAQAVLDYLYPPQLLPKKHRLSAVEFVQSEDGQYLIAELVPDVPHSQIEQILRGRPAC
ncbi:MAG: hypothetical protein BroJett011_62190 [Chloroflexota bacterium]|nr:MAG: hypothetical protein BroJett011_62190 [Chloroflexota bacterium]